MAVPAIPMKPRHSNSLLFVWQVADLEAKRLQAAFLEPGHLLLGLCKCVDIDVLASIPSSAPQREALLEELLREFRRLRESFASAGFDAMRFRRHYRTVLPEGSAGLNLNSGNLHRTDSAKDVFNGAEKIAEIAGTAVYPIHVLYSLMVERDEARDEAMRVAGSDPRRLRQVLNEQMTPQPNDTSARNRGVAQWN